MWLNVKFEEKIRPKTGHEYSEGEWIYSSTLSLTSALDGVGWSKPHLGLFTPGKEPVRIVQEAGWVSRPDRKGAESLLPTMIRPLDSRSRSESLYRLSYIGLHMTKPILK
jgi:hypothetical protein